MFDIVAISLCFLAVLVGLFDLMGMVVAAVKYWRISFGVLAAVAVIVALCFLTKSIAFRWIVGFHVFVAIVTTAVLWEQNQGRLKD
jgi:hypothetical protein